MSQAFKFEARAPHLTVGQGGIAGELGLLRKQVGEAFDIAQQSGVYTARFVGISTDATAAAGIKAQFASAAAPVTLVNADFDGPLAPGTGPAIINTPKRLTFTVGSGGTPANFTGSNIIWSGFDIYGNDLEETTVAAAGAGTTTTVNYFAALDQVQIVSAQGGTAAQLTIGTLGDTAAIASLVSSASAQIIDPTVDASWNRARVGNRLMKYPRRISFVFSSSASWITSSIVVTGPDVNGNMISSSIAVPNGGGSTVITDKFFAGHFRISIPAQGGALGTLAVGPESTSVGLAVDPISNIEAVAVVREAARANAFGAWSVPTAGAVDDSSIANSGPYGRYTPDSSVVPDGVREYVLAYFPKAA